jgi:hypothetical protein
MIHRLAVVSPYAFMLKFVRILEIFLSYHTFFSHVKARIQETLKNIDLRIGSDDESGLTKALDSVFPEATRLLCTKHIVVFVVC